MTEEISTQNSTSESGGGQIDDAEFERAFVRNLDRIVRILDERMRRDGDQTGGRFWGRRY